MRLFVYFLFGLVLVLPASLFASTFYRTLSFGMTGEDVRYLQSLLNKDSRTQVVATGPGSPGQESLFFGQKTRDAVMRFQELYKYEILIPLGISTPTGIVGARTQEKLLNLIDPFKNTSTEISSGNIPNIISVPAINNSGTVKDLLDSFLRLPIRLFAVTPLSARPGGEVAIQGQGFMESNNTVHFGDSFKVEGVSSDDTFSLKVKVPNNLPEGSYNVWVSNQKGTTFNISFGAFFSVSNNPIERPRIITPDIPLSVRHGASSESITLGVEGVSSGDINVTTSIGDIKGFVDENNKLTFSLSEASQWKNLSFSSDFSRNRFLPIYIYIRNGAGFSDPATVLVQFIQ